jgi:hypothetical protein
LYLAETDVDDEDLKWLGQLTNLQYLALGNRVTEAGIEDLRIKFRTPDIGLHFAA